MKKLLLGLSAVVAVLLPLRKCHEISVAEYPSVVAVKLNIYERSHDILIV